jgi:hypothetical protein
MGKKRQIKLVTNLTKLNDLKDTKLSALKNFLVANTKGNSWKPIDEVGVWKVQIIAELHDSWLDADNTYVVQSTFEDSMSYMDALTMAVRMFDEEYMEDYTIAPTEATACNKLISVKAIAMTL